jgi:xylulokinase
MAQYLAGIDAGTTGCKTCIFDLDGTVVSTDYREYPCDYPQPGWVEQTSETLIPPLFESCRAAVESSGLDPAEIVAVAISSQGSIIGLLDDSGQALRPWVGWQDVRGVPYIEKLQERISRERYYEITGDPLGTVFSSTKLAWLKDHEPEHWERTALFATEQEFINRQWGATEWWTDQSSASREGTADVDNFEWSAEIHELLDIPLSKRAQLAKGPMVLGEISAEAATKSGLAPGTMLCLGAHDQNCSSYGAGAVDAGDTVMVIGTFGSCFVVLDRPTRDPHARLVVKPNHGLDNWTIEAFSTTSASAFRWYRDTFADVEVAASRPLQEDPYDLITRAVGKGAPGAGGVTFLPFLQGASGARINGNARGAFVGMSLATNKADMARAVLEGICFEMADILSAQAAAGIEIGTIRLTGGAAKSPLWCQMLADVFDRPIELLQTSETGCLGAALYAGVAAGLYPDCREAAARSVSITRRFEPDAEAHRAYQPAFQRFVDLYEALDGRVF